MAGDMLVSCKARGIYPRIKVALRVVDTLVLDKYCQGRAFFIVRRKAEGRTAMKYAKYSRPAAFHPARQRRWRTQDQGKRKAE